MNPNIDQSNGRTGRWKADEDSKLKDAVKMHGGKSWDKITVLVPGRTKKQCWNRWCDALDPCIDLASVHTGKWTEDELIKLKGAVHTHGGKDWIAIAAMVPGRTKIQCRLMYNRWKKAQGP